MRAKLSIAVLSAAVLIAFGALTTSAQEEPCCDESMAGAPQEVVEPAQKTCPVMGGEIDKNVYTDYKGKRVYFCCAGCAEAFKKDPDEYLAQMEKKGVVLEDTPIEQKTCPMSGKPLNNRDQYVDYQGKRIYFCCAGCVEKFKKDPEKYIDQMKAKGTVLEDAPIEQKTCPVSGKPVNGEVYTDYEGKRIYFCCENAKKEFLKSPEKYLEKE